MTSEQVKLLTPGTKLIFIDHGGCLNYKQNYVFTFSNIFISDYPHSENRYVQFNELHGQGNHEHNAGCDQLEIYNPDIHKDGIIVTREILEQDLMEFQTKYGKD